MADADLPDIAPFGSPIDDSYLTRDEVARLYRVSTRTLIDWEDKGYGPPVVRISPRVTLYQRRAAVDFLRSNLVTGSK